MYPANRAIPEQASDQSEIAQATWIGNLGVVQLGFPKSAILEYCVDSMTYVKQMEIKQVAEIPAFKKTFGRKSHLDNEIVV